MIFTGQNGRVTGICVGVVLVVRFVIVVLVIFAILLYVMFKLYLSCYFFASYGTVYIRLYFSYYYYLEFIGFISYSYNVFLSKTSLEDPADSGPFYPSQSA